MMMESSSACLSCNLCFCKVDGIAYRTHCKHFYCPTCAKKSFQNDSFCPICKTNLTSGEVLEVNIGIPNVSLSDALFQNALQNTSWDKIIENLNKSAFAVAEVTRFVTEQLYMESHHNNQDKSKLVHEMQMQHSQMGRLNDRIIDMERQQSNAHKQFENQLGTKNKELIELQEAYKEKLRKCQAWEKAYNNVRAQLTEKSGGGSTISGGGGVMVTTPAENSGFRRGAGGVFDQDREFVPSASSASSLMSADYRQSAGPVNAMSTMIGGGGGGGMSAFGGMDAPLARSVRQSTDYMTTTERPGGGNGGTPQYHPPNQQPQQQSFTYVQHYIPQTIPAAQYYRPQPPLQQQQIVVPQQISPPRAQNQGAYRQQQQPPQQQPQAVQSARGMSYSMAAPGSVSGAAAGSGRYVTGAKRPLDAAVTSSSSFPPQHQVFRQSAQAVPQYTSSSMQNIETAGYRPNCSSGGDDVFGEGQRATSSGSTTSTGSKRKGSFFD